MTAWVITTNTLHRFAHLERNAAYADLDDHDLHIARVQACSNAILALHGSIEQWYSNTDSSAGYWIKAQLLDYAQNLYEEGNNEESYEIRRALEVLELTRDELSPLTLQK